MASLIIKIGQNEPDTYDQIHKLSKHLDIIDFLHTPIIGRKVMELFLVIGVDLSSLAAKKAEQLPSVLKEPETEILDHTIDPNTGDPSWTYIINKRKWYLDIPNVTWLSQAMKDTIETQATLKMAIKTNWYDYISTNNLVWDADARKLDESVLDAEFNRVVALDGKERINLTFEDYQKLTPASKKEVIGYISSKHCAEKLTEFEKTFDMRNINQLMNTVDYSVLADFIVDKTTGNTLKQVF